MVTNDYLFAVLFIVCAWFILHSGGVHFLHH